jgi:O-antigen ligase
MNILLTVLFLGIVVRNLRKDFMQGLAVAVFFFVTLTTHIGVQLGSFLPNFTIHRLILLALLYFWWQRRKGQAQPEIPLKRQFVAVAAAFFVAMLLSTSIKASFKEFLSFFFEIMVFYFIAVTSLRDRSDIFRVLRAALAGLTVVGIIAAIEKSTGFNPVDQIPGYVRRSTLVNDVMSTYPQRILFGTAMAMGWVLCMTLMHAPQGMGWPRRRLWVIAVLLAYACYISFSRGPWLALALGGMILLALGSKAMRKQLSVIGLLTVLALTCMSGVRETIFNLAADTLDIESSKGTTYEYRWELWRKAYAEISKSPGHLLFGYGPGTTQVMDLSGEISFLGVEESFWSWDNNFAAYLIEDGFVGLGALAVLFGSLMFRLWSIWRVSQGLDRDLLAGMIAGICVLLFMMSNVMIFAPQLTYLCWTMAACGMVIGKLNAASRAKDS